MNINKYRKGSASAAKQRDILFKFDKKDRKNLQYFVKVYCIK
jgi:hypothetical protein